MEHWIDYSRFVGGRSHTVQGDVVVWGELASPQLSNRRPLLVYLPPTYHRSVRAYPVLYMHDGQNLFDGVTSFAGEWQVDETMEALSREGLEALVVGVPNMGAARLDEYGPFYDRRSGGGRGDQYLAFLAETVKPLVDRSFRTLPGREHTALIGSSMGGLISLYGFFRYPQVYGLIGALSPSLWFAQRAMERYVRSAALPSGRLYLDVGTRETPLGVADPLRRRMATRRYVADVRRMCRLLLAKGAPPASVRYVEDRGAMHHEAAWAGRLPHALRFLLGTALPDA